MTPPGAEPHDVELSARDVERIRDADVVLYLGSGFQPALESAAREADGRKIDLLRGLELRPTAEHGGRDPHVWLDPVRYLEIGQAIGDVLGSPRDAARFASELRALHERFEEGLESCERREIVTSHAAFGYLADRYRLAQIALTGLSPHAEPTPGELERVIEEVRARDVTTIFFETLVSPRLAATVARETGARTAVLNPIEGLTEDEAAAGEDYFTLMDANLKALREALGCR